MIDFALRDMLNSPPVMDRPPVTLDYLARLAARIAAGLRAKGRNREADQFAASLHRCETRESLLRLLVAHYNELSSD